MLHLEVCTERAWVEQTIYVLFVISYLCIFWNLTNLKLEISSLASQNCIQDLRFQHMCQKITITKMFGKKLILVCNFYFVFFNLLSFPNPSIYIICKVSKRMLMNSMPLEIRKAYIISMISDLMCTFSKKSTWTEHLFTYLHLMSKRFSGMSKHDLPASWLNVISSRCSICQTEKATGWANNGVNTIATALSINWVLDRTRNKTQTSLP